jgi:hypothetical protein
MTKQQKIEYYAVIKQALERKYPIIIKDPQALGLSEDTVDNKIAEAISLLKGENLPLDSDTLKELADKIVANAVNDTTVLNEAKAYTDTGLTNTLNEAKAYTDNAVANLQTTIDVPTQEEVDTIFEVDNGGSNPSSSNVVLDANTTYADLQAIDSSVQIPEGKFNQTGDGIYWDGDITVCSTYTGGYLFIPVPANATKLKIVFSSAGVTSDSLGALNITDSENGNIFTYVDGLASSNSHASLSILDNDPIEIGDVINREDIVDLPNGITSIKVTMCHYQSYPYNYRIIHELAFLEG